LLLLVENIHVNILFIFIILNYHCHFFRAMDLRNIRKDYQYSVIGDDDFPVEPVHWFRSWLQEAIESGETEATAMVLSTVSAEWRPSARVVLLKSVDDQGFVFYSNYLSRKGIQLFGNHAAALTFYWPLTERQVRVEGMVAKTDPVESDTYFYSRPLESQVNAVISPQSSPISSRQQLERERERILFAEGSEAILRPEHWGGYRLKPDRIEFWQGRPGRLHDRIMYMLEGNVWNISRLAP
jgi:pyridoxamine 5'-phosphate oxidase